MEKLPAEVVEIIAQYLTTRELAACCATSRVWRDMFGQDNIWKQRCDTHIAKYLATAESRVNPQFVAPECTDIENSLNSVGEWRLAYLREQFLWRHWRNGNFLMEQLTLNSSSEREEIARYQFLFTLFYFVTDDYLIILNKKRVMLWYIRNSPVYVSDPFQLLFHDYETSFLTFLNNKLIIVQKTAVKIFDCGLPLKSNWILETSFMFDRTECVPLSKGVEISDFPKTFGCLVIENLFLGILSSGEIHVWNLKSNTKLKKVSYLNSTTNGMAVKVVNSKTPLMDIVLVVRINTTYHYFVFCFANLDFYPFNTSHSDKTFPSCGIQNGLLAISFNDCFKVFDYRTSQLVMIVPAFYTAGVLTLNNDFLLVTNTTVHVFHTITGTWESILLSLVDQFKYIQMLHGIKCGKFLITSDGQGLQQGQTAWDIDLKSTPMKIVCLEKFNFCNNYVINKACTKVASRSWDGFIQIVSYW
ncbi:uncharacterized protein LOC124367442 isoform X2 [Homalodisca vitripennis]|uniref:uncharacterized protein LOC124367442 isoform X2 n=1 Tax=Homalodisca vitripennis TaxID=197043 RepID=UPI001EEBFF52|nr:uncharacterized protein LOC124367442 isoform X2 [Homalodisca vitripennis]XP_046680212.1 uncharacterized protein LOC124367442 isoform X2 [Homalodisca vitripennis]XP_046680213.1 uncharacterized protein LOC124367442 isoform X2 [Homalodisca vitripennis]